MAFNIMDLVKDQLTPDNLGAIARMLGEDDKKTAAGMAGVVPSILGSLIGAVGKPDGEKAFGQAVEQADSGIMGSLASALGGGGGTSLASSGLKMLGSFFGDHKLALLTSAIAGFSGLSGNSSKSLLGLALPMVLGMLKKKGASDRLDSKGLIGMLMGQKDNVAKAMPADLGKALAGSGLLDSLAGTAPARPAPALSAMSAPPPAAPATKAPERKSGSLLGKLIPLILLALAALLAYQFLLRPKMAQTPPAVITQGSTVGAVADQGVALTETVTRLVRETGLALNGITDAATARSALSSLQRIDSDLAGAVNLAARLTPSQQQSVAATAAGLTADLRRSAVKASSAPGASAVIGDTLSSIMASLQLLSGGK